jgi:hypothetical protein
MQSAFLTLAAALVISGCSSAPSAPSGSTAPSKHAEPEKPMIGPAPRRSSGATRRTWGSRRRWKAGDRKIGTEFTNDLYKEGGDDFNFFLNGLSLSRRC